MSAGVEEQAESVPPSPLQDVGNVVDPLGDAEAAAAANTKHNRAKVGSGRPSSLLYTYGPGAVMDLPQFTIMPTGLDDWQRIWARRDHIPEIHAPRLRDAVRTLMRSRDVQLRPFPRQPKKLQMSTEGNDLGVPARVFPQWLRCTGCDRLGQVSQFRYENTHPYRPDLACFEHEKCYGRREPDKARPKKAVSRTATPARYLLACEDGHLDEFPYDGWVHHWQPCARAEHPVFTLADRTSGKGASAVVRCASCGLSRPMNEAQGDQAVSKLPRCRGRHPHLDAFDPAGCDSQVRLMLIGASNLWFPATESVIVMPASPQESVDNLGDAVRLALGDKLAKYWSQLDIVRDLLEGKVDVTAKTDEELAHAVAAAMDPPTPGDEQDERARNWDPVDLLVPEWQHLQKDPIGPQQADELSGLTLTKQERHDDLVAPITRVLAVDRLRKVNALVGFTRIDDMERAGDLPRRLVPLCREPYPTWTVATEDRGEGVFLELDEQAVASWEAAVEPSPLWIAHREAHRRNFLRRFSETAENTDPDSRFRPPRYWLVHTLAHALIREMAMECGYSAASLSERLYAWQASADRAPAAGLLVCTTASDSDGTLGGLVALSDRDRLHRLVSSALTRMRRCSSDPVCGMRVPRDPEDFLHGAACHSCVMASETSCERANRFLDRRFLVDLPGTESHGFFDRKG